MTQLLSEKKKHLIWVLTCQTTTKRGDKGKKIAEGNDSYGRTLQKIKSLPVASGKNGHTQ